MTGRPQDYEPDEHDDEPDLDRSDHEADRYLDLFYGKGF